MESKLRLAGSVLCFDQAMRKGEEVARFPSSKFEATKIVATSNVWTISRARARGFGTFDPIVELIPHSCQPTTFVLTKVRHANLISEATVILYAARDCAEGEPVTAVCSMMGCLFYWFSFRRELFKAHGECSCPRCLVESKSERETTSEFESVKWDFQHFVVTQARSVRVLDLDDAETLVAPTVMSSALTEILEAARTMVMQYQGDRTHLQFALAYLADCTERLCRFVIVRSACPETRTMFAKFAWLLGDALYLGVLDSVPSQDLNAFELTIFCTWLLVRTRAIRSRSRTPQRRAPWLILDPWVKANPAYWTAFQEIYCPDDTPDLTEAFHVGLELMNP